MPLQQLKILWLSDNPCAEVPHYRSFVIAHLRSLEKLDNLDVTTQERTAAASIPLLPAATPAELLESHNIEPPAEISSRSTSPAAARQQGSPHPASPEPASSRSRVPGGKTAVYAEPWSNPIAPMGQPAVTSSRESEIDVTCGAGVPVPHLAAAGPAEAAEESFAFSRQHYEPHRHSSQSGNLLVQLQHQQMLHSIAVMPSCSSSSCNADSSHGKASPNVLYAVMALLADLDAAGLSIVKKEVDQRLQGLRG